MKRLLAEGKIDEKAVFVVRALCPDFSAVARDNAFGDGQAEAVASVPVPCAVQPCKALENFPAVGGGEGLQLTRRTGGIGFCLGAQE